MQEKYQPAFLVGLDSDAAIGLNDAGNDSGLFKKLHTSIRDIVYHARTIYLFTCDVLIPMIIPWTATGVVDAFHGGLFVTESTVDFLGKIQRIPHAFLWLWLNTLAFAITNQMAARSVTEDSINKPWRAIPSGQITSRRARNLLLGLVPAVYVITTYLGAGSTTLMALILNWMYNDLGGSDVHYVVRNLINALAMVVSSIGTTQVAIHEGFSNGSTEFTLRGYQWLTIKAAIIFTTLQVQDLRDQDGDRSRLRSTVPIVIGDELARWSVAVPILIWSLLTPYFWGMSASGFVLPVLLGMVMSIRVLLLRDVEADQVTWRLWGLWTLSIFFLPLCKYVEGLVAVW
ncbi:MAG: hypothetical protein Q9217_001450 [Psora testacea]